MSQAAPGLICKHIEQSAEPSPALLSLLRKHAFWIAAGLSLNNNRQDKPRRGLTKHGHFHPEILI
jgi:hypothetical protein